MALRPRKIMKTLSATVATTRADRADWPRGANDSQATTETPLQRSRSSTAREVRLGAPQEQQRGQAQRRRL